MTKYSTGELAKLCGVSVRTVQYYDNRGILVPSELSEGGRRLYTDQDLNRLKIICFLREAGISINGISQLLEEEDPGSVISVLLEKQKSEVVQELEACQKKLDMLEGISRNLKTVEDFSLEAIGDIAQVMQSRKKLKKVRITMLATAIPLGILEWASILLWIFRGNFWPFTGYCVLIIPYCFWLFRYYWEHISYICPRCHAVFKPRKKEFLFADHTSTTRKLTCTHCGSKGFCVET